MTVGEFDLAYNVFLYDRENDEEVELLTTEDETWAVKMFCAQNGYEIAKWGPHDDENDLTTENRVKGLILSETPDVLIELVNLITQKTLRQNYLSERAHAIKREVEMRRNPDFEEWHLQR